jgi:hypothetical protein
MARYDALSKQTSIDELLEKATFEGKNIEDSDSLMNAFVQFRKVCSKPS